MYNKYKQKFAIKKFTVGVASVFIGGTALMATDVLPFDIVNVASANESSVETESITKDGINYELKNNNTKGYSLNGESEYLMLKLQGINAEAAKDSISVVVEKTGPVSVSMSSPMPDIKAEIIGNTTTLKLGSFTEGSYYSIPIFSKYNQNTDNGTESTLNIKVIDNVTGEVLFTKTINQINRASEIIGLEGGNIEFQAGEYNTVSNKVVSNNFYNTDWTLRKLSTYLLSNAEYPKGGDTVKTTIVSGEEFYEVRDNIVVPKDYTVKITTPVTIRQEVFNSQGVSKNIVKEITITPVWKDVKESTTWIKKDDNIKEIKVAPGIRNEYKYIINEDKVLEKEYNSTEVSNENSRFQHVAGMLTPVHKEYKTTNETNVNSIEYSFGKYNPKAFKFKQISSEHLKNEDKTLDIGINILKDRTKNLEKSKLYIIKENGEKEYLFEGKNLLEMMNSITTMDTINKIDFNSNISMMLYYGAIPENITLDEYTQKYFNMTLEEYIKQEDTHIHISLKYEDFGNFKEIGVEFPENAYVTANEKDIYKRDYRDRELEKTVLEKNNIVYVDYSINNVNNKDSVLSTKAEVVYSDNTILSNDTTTRFKVSSEKIILPEVFPNNQSYPSDKIDKNIYFLKGLTTINNNTGERVKMFDYKLKSENVGEIRILTNKVNGLDVGNTNNYSDVTNPKKININGEDFYGVDILYKDGVYHLSGLDRAEFKITDNLEILKNQKHGDAYVSDSVYVYIQIPNALLDTFVTDNWERMENLSNENFTIFKSNRSFSYSIIPAEGFYLKDKIISKDSTEINEANKEIEIETRISNITNTEKQGLSVIQVIPKENSLTLTGEKYKNAGDTVFDSISNIPAGWEVYYSTTVRQEGENVNVITDWTKELPADKTKITHLKWVKTQPFSPATGETLRYNVLSKNIINTKENHEENGYFIKTVSGFNLGNNDVWGGSIPDKLRTTAGSVVVKYKVFIDSNNNNVKDNGEVEFSEVTKFSPLLPVRGGASMFTDVSNYSASFKKIIDFFDEDNKSANADPDTDDTNSKVFLHFDESTTLTFKKQIGEDGIPENISGDITDEDVIAVAYENMSHYYNKEKNPELFKALDNVKITAIGVTEDSRTIKVPYGFGEKEITINYYLKVEGNKESLTIKYYDTSTGEIVKTESTNPNITPNVSSLIRRGFKEKDALWKIDLTTEHIHPVTKENITENPYFSISENDNILTYKNKEEDFIPYIGKALEVYVPVKADKAGKVDIILKDKETGEPLKITNLVTENTEKKGTTVTITDTVAPNYITIGDNTYKKVDKPNLPTEAIVPGETDNADVEFEYELVRGAVYGVFKAENGNNIVKDKVTIIEGGQPEDTRVEYTAPSKITDDNGKVWDLVSPKETVSYTNSEKATEHILTYREVKKNVTVKYVTESGEVIKEETAFENKSVGSKYTINTPETITKDNVIYNVFGEREVSRVVEDNDNIVTIQVTPKQKQVAIVKFVDNNGEEIEGIERKRVEGYDGTPINVTLNNISNYRITTNPFETPQVFDTDNNVDQEFNVVLEKLPTTAIPFETEYVADETREYSSENIVEREGEEGVREDNGDVTKQPVNKIVKVATGPKVERKETPFNVIYEADESKSFGDNTTEKGKNKVEEITTTYTLDSNTGNVTSVTSTTIVENGSPEIHKLGTKAKTEVEVIEYKTEYVEDKTLEYGKEKVITEGVAGEKTTTTTYRLDGNTVVANNPIVEITKQPINKVVAKGTKATETVIKETPFTTITKEDSTLNKGEEVIEVEGVNGKTVTITEYTLNKETGEVTSTTREEVREAVNKVIRVGTKETSTNVETDTPTAEEEKAKEDKNSDAWGETANEYNKQKETIETKDNPITPDKKETITNEQSKENNSEVKVVQDAEVKAKELPKTNTNSTLLYTATALIGLATLLRRKQNQ